MPQNYPSVTSGRAQLQAAPTAGLGSRWCGKADRADAAPVPGPFGAVLDDKASAEALNEMTFGLPLAIGGQRADRRQRHQRHPDPGVQHLGDMARWW